MNPFFLVTLEPFLLIYGLDNFGKLFSSAIAGANDVCEVGQARMKNDATRVWGVWKSDHYLFSLCSWSSCRFWFNSFLELYGGRGTLHTFSRQALPMVWDFAESDPFNPLGANYKAGIEAISITIKLCALGQSPSGRALQWICLIQLDWWMPLSPIRLDSVPYADLSDFSMSG